MRAREEEVERGYRPSFSTGSIKSPGKKREERLRAGKGERGSKRNGNARNCGYNDEVNLATEYREPFNPHRLPGQDRETDERGGGGDGEEERWEKKKKSISWSTARATERVTTKLSLSGSSLTCLLRFLPLSSPSPAFRLKIRKK